MLYKVILSQAYNTECQEGRKRMGTAALNDATLSAQYSSKGSRRPQSNYTSSLIQMQICIIKSTKQLKMQIWRAVCFSVRICWEEKKLNISIKFFAPFFIPSVCIFLFDKSVLKVFGGNLVLLATWECATRFSTQVKQLAGWYEGRCLRQLSQSWSFFPAAAPSKRRIMSTETWALVVRNVQLTRWRKLSRNKLMRNVTVCDMKYKFWFWEKGNIPPSSMN